MRCGIVQSTILIALGLLCVPLASEAQRPGKAVRVGILQPTFPRSWPTVQAFEQGLRDLGYVEGQTILLEFRYAEGKLDRFPALAADLVRLRPDVIATWLPSGLQAVQQVTTTIPIVSLGASLLVELGLVASLKHPGGNITWMEVHSLGLSGKRLELLKDAVPQIREYLAAHGVL